MRHSNVNAPTTFLRIAIGMSFVLIVCLPWRWAAAAPVEVRLVTGIGSAGFPVQVFLSMAPGDSASFVKVAIEYDIPFATFCCAAIGQAASPSQSTLTVDSDPPFGPACSTESRVVVASISGNKFTGSNQEVLQFYFNVRGSDCANDPLPIRFSCACMEGGQPRWFVRAVNPPHDYCFGDEGLTAIDGTYRRLCSTGVQTYHWAALKQLYR